MSPLLQSFVPSTKLQQLVYNQVILTSLKETVGIEFFDRATILTELSTSHDMIPLHIIYFTGLCLIVYNHSHLLVDQKKEETFKYAYLLKDGVRFQKMVRRGFLLFFFLFTKSVENAI